MESKAFNYYLSILPFTVTEMGFYLGELAWPGIEEFLLKHNVTIIPVGSCEQHGPHLSARAYNIMLCTRIRKAI